MADNSSKQRASSVPRWARYAYWGGFAGLFSALGVLFIFSVFYGENLGMGAGSCLAFGCAATTLLSQPAGLIGLVTGIVVGSICGVVGHHVSK